MSTTPMISVTPLLHNLQARLHYPLQFWEVQPKVALLYGTLLTLTAFLSPLGFAVFLVAAYINGGFSPKGAVGPQSAPSHLSASAVRPSGHNPLAKKLFTPFRSARETPNSYTYPTQLVPQSICLHFLRNRLVSSEGMMFVVSAVVAIWRLSSHETRSSDLVLLAHLLVGALLAKVWVSTVFWLTWFQAGTAPIGSAPSTPRSARQNKGAFPTPSSAEKRPSFLEDAITIVDGDTEAGDNRRYYAAAEGFAEEARILERGMSTRAGMPYSAYLYARMTYMQEFKVQVLVRMIAYDLGALWHKLKHRCSWRSEKTTAAIDRDLESEANASSSCSSGEPCSNCEYGPELSGHNIYGFIVNTSLACWLQSSGESLSTPTAPTTATAPPMPTAAAVAAAAAGSGGSMELVFRDALLPYNMVDLKLWATITLQVDPERQTVGQMALEPYNNGGDVVEVITTTSLAEIAAVLDHVLKLYAHPLVHYWANAVEDVTEEEWKLAKVAHHSTQTFNVAAVAASYELTGYATSSDFFAVAVSHCLKAGLPVHDKSIKRIASHSTSHMMMSDARRALEKVLPDMPFLRREGILQATVMHSADHYYNFKLLPHSGHSEILNSSFRLIMCAITQPLQYHARPDLMCRHHVRTDAVCKAIYEACAAHDKEYADQCLTLGVLA